MTKRLSDLQTCDFSKTVLMMIVILTHCANYTGGGLAFMDIEMNAFLYGTASWFNSFNTAGFTLISGYIFYYLRYERKHYPSFTPFVTNKVKRLVIPYIAVALLWTIPINNQFYHFTTHDIFLRFVWNNNSFSLWFLSMLFWTFVIAYIAFTENIIRNAFTTLALCVIGIFSAKLHLPLILGTGMATEFLLYFFIGFTIRQKFKDLRPKRSLCYGLVFLIINVMTWYVWQYCLSIDNSFSEPLRRISRMSGAIWAFLLLGHLAQNVDCNAKWFMPFQKMSFQIYLLHEPLVFVLIWHLYGRIDAMLLVALCAVVSITVSMAIAMVISKTPFRILLGMKK